MNRQLTHARAFTLIELLVVVAIIALLLSILLPSLNRAKEQGRITVCLSNMRTLSQGAVSYMTENDEIAFAFPFQYMIDGTPVSFQLITEFIWGGGVPDKTAGEYAAARVEPTAYNPYGAFVADIVLVRPKDRPLNKFMSSSVSWDDPERRHPNARRNTKKMDLPGFFKCPSDKTPHVPLAGTPSLIKEADSPFKTWEFWGTSYASNWYWPYYYQTAPPGNQPPYSGNFGTIVGGNGPARVRSLGRHIMKDKNSRWAAEFMLFYENRFNYAMNNARPRGAPNQFASSNFMGWHGQRDYHVGAFLDGSARYNRFDTRYVDGPGWTTWPNKPWQGTWAPYNGN